MTHLAAATVDTTGLSDRAVSILRTVVPGAWSALIAWALGRWPALADTLTSWGVDLTSAAVQSVVMAAVLAAWYAGWRWAEPRIPAWLVRLVLGSSASPTYGVAQVATTSADGAAVITGVLSAEQRHELASLVASLGPDAPASQAVAALGITASSTTA